MKRIFLTILLLCSAAGAITPVQNIDVEVSQSRTYPLSVLQGETYQWRWRYLQNGVEMDLSAADTVRMTWQSRGVSYAIDGALYQGGSNGVATVTWASTNATPAGTYQYVTAVMDGTVALARSRGSLTVHRGVDPGGDAPIWMGVTAADLLDFAGSVTNTFLRVYEASPGVWKHLLPGEVAP